MDDLETWARMGTAQLRALLMSPRHCRACGVELEARPGPGRPMVEALLLAWFGNAARVMRPGGSFYVWGGHANLGNYPLALKAADLYFSQAIIWDKEHPVLTRKDLMGAHEWSLYGWKEGAAHRFFGPPNATDLWHVKKVSPNVMVHLTEKPVELARRAIEYSSLPGEAVLDPFAGSGSTSLQVVSADAIAET